MTIYLNRNFAPSNLQTNLALSPSQTSIAMTNFIFTNDLNIELSDYNEENVLEITQKIESLFDNVIKETLPNKKKLTTKDLSPLKIDSFFKTLTQLTAKGLPLKVFRLSGLHLLNKPPLFFSCETLKISFCEFQNNSLNPIIYSLSWINKNLKSISLWKTTKITNDDLKNFKNAIIKSETIQYLDFEIASGNEESTLYLTEIFNKTESLIDFNLTIPFEATQFNNNQLSKIKEAADKNPSLKSLSINCSLIINRYNRQYLTSHFLNDKLENMVAQIKELVKLNRTTLFIDLSKLNDSREIPDLLNQINSLAPNLKKLTLLNGKSLKKSE